MRIYTSKISTKRKKSEIEALLKKKILNDNSSFYVFPFCLFSKTFYQDWKESRDGLFIGKIKDSKFELQLTSKVFSTRNWLPVKLLGEINDDSILIKFIVPKAILFTLAILILVDILINKESTFDNILFILSGVLIISYMIKIFRIKRIFIKT